MRARPVRLNAAIAWLFMVGAAAFVLGSVPSYANGVGGSADGVTYFVGSILFTAASFGQLVQAQSPAMTVVTGAKQHEPASIALCCFVALAHNLTARQEDKHVWRPDVFGSTLFLVASSIGILALDGRFLSIQRSQPWRIAGLNMAGSMLFMGSAIASFALPRTGDMIDRPVSVAGTLLGAACFLAGAALIIPAWRQAVRGPTVGRPPDPLKPMDHRLDTSTATPRAPKEK